MAAQLVDGREMTVAATMVCVHHHQHVPAERRYRLIDGCCEPHAQLDGIYQSIDDAIGEAIAWLLASAGGDQHSLIGIEVCTGNGDWRTCRLPMPLLCALRPGATS